MTTRRPARWEVGTYLAGPSRKRGVPPVPAPSSRGTLRVSATAAPPAPGRSRTGAARGSRRRRRSGRGRRRGRRRPSSAALGVGGADLGADPGRALGDDGVAEAGDEDAVVEEAAGGFDRGRRSPTIRGTIALSPSSGSRPRSPSRRRKVATLARRRPTRPGSSASRPRARRALAATVGARPLEKSCGRERCSSTRQSGAAPATKPPAAPPSALPSVPVVMSTASARPNVRRSRRRARRARRGRGSRRRSAPRRGRGRARQLRQPRQVALHREDPVGDHQLAARVEPSRAPASASRSECG